MGYYAQLPVRSKRGNMRSILTTNFIKAMIEQNGGKIRNESEERNEVALNYDETMPEDKHELYAGSSKKPEPGFLYSCDHSREIAFTTMQGEINSGVLRKELNQIWGRSDYHPQYHVLVDISKATFRFDTNDISDIFDIFESMPVNKKNKKFALLTATPQQVALSAMFGQNIKTKFPFIVEIFSTHEAALNWLGV